MLAALPLDDWQFYVVTLLALGAVFLIARPFFPSKNKPACGGCATGTEPKKPKVKLTVRGK